MLYKSDTAPGNADTLNEDWMAATSDLIVVLDGATVRTSTGCRHGVAWFTRKLGAAIIATAAQHSTPLPEVLATAIREVAELHPECDLTHPGTPSAAVAIVRHEGETVRHLVLGDVFVVLDVGGGEPQVISDDRVSKTGAAERAEADRWPIGSPEKAEALLTMKHAELAARNQPGGYWIAAADPGAVQQALTGEIASRDIQRLAVLTDGAARLVTMFHRRDWRTALDLLEDAGPTEFIAHVRRAEASDPDGREFHRNKSSDDATVVFATPKPYRSRVVNPGTTDQAAREQAIADIAGQFLNSPNIMGEQIRA
jgi:hypothetical protein